MTAKDQGKLLIITGSHDSTTDFLLPLLTPATSVFRLNTDFFLKYKLDFDHSGFKLTDPVGRSCTSQEIYKAFWRWPEWCTQHTEESRYVQGEARCLLQEITNLIWSQGKFVLVEPGALRRLGKLLQLTRAREFFNVPPFRAVLNLDGIRQNGGPEVVKSMGKCLPDERLFFSTRVDPSQLAEGYPWFFQRYQEATFDITVMFVRKQIFAFELARDFLETSIDWREIPDKGTAWKPFQLPEAVRDKVISYMQVLQLDFGRLDFLRDSSGEFHFCEVNCNPQFAWLDYDRKEGLVSALLDELSPETERHPIPVRHPLDLNARSESQASRRLLFVSEDRLSALHPCVRNRSPDAYEVHRCIGARCSGFLGCRPMRYRPPASSCGNVLYPALVRSARFRLN